MTPIPFRHEVSDLSNSSNSRSSAVPLLRARTPLRVSFAGGGTDVPPYPEQEGGAVLSATINRFAYGTLKPRSDRHISIHSMDIGKLVSMALEEAKPDGDSLDLVKAAIQKIAHDTDTGFDLFLHSNAPPGSGLCSSSAVVVTLVGLLARHVQLPLTDYDRAQLALTIERKDLGLKGGAQDQYATVFGGFNFIEFEGDRVVVNPLRVSTSIVNELEYNLLLCFTGSTRISDHIIDDQTTRFQASDRSTIDGLRMQKLLATEMKNALVQGQLTRFGELLDEAWTYKKMMSPRISNDHIDDLYKAAKECGALGGKVTGAGGGGYMLLYCPYDCRRKAEDALEALGAEVVPFQFEKQGSVIWSSEHD